MPEDKVTEALRFAAEPLSLSEPLREDGDAELGDVVEDRSAESPFEVAATALLPDEINRLLAPLDDASARSSSCASAWTVASPARSKRWASTSTSPGADPPDRGPGHVEAAPPLERRTARPARRLILRSPVGVTPVRRSGDPCG